MQFAPAEAAMSIVEGPKPPSTCKPKFHVFQSVFMEKSKRHLIFLMRWTCRANAEV